MSDKHLQHLLTQPDLAHLVMNNNKSMLFQSFNFPINRVAKVANVTTDTELIGIKIAAMTGERFPVRAIEIPMIL
ncbi:MAG: hypothetical protein IPF54_16335 [Draconibacterium sp.]|nr:hypothetical protein [Draconibacterium sp.]